jgi:DNA polymerase-4
MNTRTILHIDMNAFFAAVEQQSDPALRGKPVAVIGSGARTIITTSTYEARAFGVKTGMTVYEAKRLCPKIIMVVGNNRKYTDTSTGIINIFRNYTPMVEVFSIDEAFLDVTGSLKIFGSAKRISMLIKAHIYQRYGLTCSVGIAPNKLLAKLASDMQKPDGLTIIAPDRISQTLENLPIEELCGIGSRTQQQLNLLSITTCGQLGRFQLKILKKRFGVIGERLQRMGLGIDDSPVTPTSGDETVKTVGHSTTLPFDIDTRDEICRWLLRLSEMVGHRARRYGVSGRTVTLTIRYSDFTTFSRQETGGDSLSQSHEIYRAAVAILDRLNLQQPVRLLGVRLSNLHQQESQYHLFPEVRKYEQLTEAVDTVNDRFGSFSVTYGSSLDRQKNAKVISPAWRPEGLRNVDVE